MSFPTELAAVAGVWGCGLALGLCWWQLRQVSAMLEAVHAALERVAVALHKRR